MLFRSFQPTPPSCSCIHITFSAGIGLPWSSLSQPEKYLMEPRQSHPNCKLFPQLPAPASPRSKACFRCKGLRGSTSGQLSPFVYVDASLTSVGHCHLADAESIEQWPPVKSNIMNCCSFAIIEANHERPLLPVNSVLGDSKARSIRLVHVQWLQI